MSVSPPRMGGIQNRDERDYDAEAALSRLDSKVFQRFFAFVRPYRGRAILALLAVLGFTGTQVSLPLVIRLAVDSAVGNTKTGLDTALMLFAGLIAVNAVFSFLQEWISARLAQRVIFDLRRAMFAHLQDVSLGFLDQMQVGRLMSRLQGDVNSLQEFLEQSVSALGDMALLAGIILVLLSLDWSLGLLTLALVPVLVGVRAFWLPWAQGKFRRARAASSTVNAALAENINGIRTVQESRRESVNFEHYRVKAEENFRAQIGSALAGQLMVPMVDTLTGAAMAILIIVAGQKVLAGSLNVGVMVAFMFYVQRFFDPIRTLSMQYTVLQRAVTAGHRIFEVLDVPVTLAEKPGAVTLRNAPPRIEFEHVQFGYRSDQPVLRDISFCVEPGQTLALVGATGSGKTSIAALTHRFHDVWSGAVRIGGIDVRDLTLDSLGETVAMVLQEPFLFTGTVYENIRYQTGATREEVMAAALAVRADDFIQRLPDGYDTVLGQRGRSLSIGQRQLISFARALVADPKILILDEATANIDSFTEREIQQALKTLQEGRTSLIIAHRLATIRDADQILVLDHGRILEQGNHDSLVRAGGRYAELHAKSQGAASQ